jgi:hypothetical protein
MGYYSIPSIIQSPAAQFFKTQFLQKLQGRDVVFFGVGCCTLMWAVNNIRKSWYGKIETPLVLAGSLAVTGLGHAMPRVASITLLGIACLSFCKITRSGPQAPKPKIEYETTKPATQVVEREVEIDPPRPESLKNKYDAAQFKTLLLHKKDWSDTDCFTLYGDLKLGQDDPATTWPKNLEITGKLILDGYKHGPTLPENLIVGSHFSVINCSSLQSLPEKVNIGHIFCVYASPLLEKWPDTLQTKQLQVYKCPNLCKTLPKWDTAEDAPLLVGSFGDNELSDEILKQLSDATTTKRIFAVTENGKKVALPVKK